MSATSIRNPIEPLERKDIRSAGLGFKHDKDKREKWGNGIRPGSGVRVDWNDELLSASNEAQAIKIRPQKQWSQMATDHKSHANKTPKPSGGSYDSRTRMHHKAAAVVEANDHTNSTLSKSLFDLLPQHFNNIESPIQVALRESAALADGDILYSFDNKGPSPGDKGRRVDLGGLVDLAEQKWINKKTEDIIKGEYEVLDTSGETVLLKSKGKKSPKQKAAKAERVTPQAGLDDDFEIIDAP
ncbi:uncharacterized protein RSE6_07103 [Rhynchosporium secalis]|uniref:Uncharacterized protein n=1 Tax=Rhynchosporium secalis TaxID=38038 RepID=A0A1E1MC18_RHYSE|nr:uncharacterized protein RSE6_07103 [Rhynchosporium secalis]